MAEKAIYSVNVMICATIYVVAESEDDATQQVQAFHMDGGTLSNDDEIIDGVPVSGMEFNNPNFPEISMSPAVTVYAENLSAEYADDYHGSDEGEEADDDA